MSVSEIRNRILCDGADCKATAALPIGLRALLVVPDPEAPVATGWLFITGSGPSRHFCPQCASNSNTFLDGECNDAFPHNGGNDVQAYSRLQ
jgi:hypothetical protein